MSFLANSNIPDSSPDIALSNKEEVDQLARSNKKVKFAKDSGESHIDNTKQIENRDESTRKNFSYKDMVVDAGGMGPTVTEQSCAEGPEVDDVSDNEIDKEGENDMECLTIKISKDEKRRLRNRWKDALIIKLIDHTMGYTYLVRRLKAL